MIEGERIILRAPEMEDVPVIYRWENDPEVRVISRFKTPVSAFAIEQYILNAGQDPFAAGQVRFMAIDREQQEIVGHLDLFDIDAVDRRAGIGILVEKDRRGKGYAAEMLGIIEPWCTEALHLHQLWCTIAESNEESIRLFTGAGFRQTGKRIEWSRHREGWQDELFFQKILKG